MSITIDAIRAAARQSLILSGTRYSQDRLEAVKRAIAKESVPNARWMLEQLLKNACIAERESLPLCDDTGIPHVILRIGDACALPPGWLPAVHEGIAEGLRAMPGRPMAVRGDDQERIEQTAGLFEDDPGALECAPVSIRSIPGKHLEITSLLLGGGPEIRAKTHRIFHKRSMEHVMSEVSAWLCEAMPLLGCTPVVAAVGIGRSQVEASALMLEAMAEGSVDRQNKWERKITEDLNATNVGTLGLGGSTTAFGCFLKVGPLRSSGVRIVCARPCCVVEPRVGRMLVE